MQKENKGDVREYVSTGVFVSSSLFSSKASWWVEFQVHSRFSVSCSLSGLDSFISWTE